MMEQSHVVRIPNLSKDGESHGGPMVLLIPGGEGMSQMRSMEGGARKLS